MWYEVVWFAKECTDVFAFLSLCAFGGYITQGWCDCTEAEFMNVQFHWGFLGLILRVLRLEVSLHSVYIINQFQTTFAQGGGGGVKSVIRGWQE